MMRLRALVVDDEPLAREVILDLLEQDPDIEVVGEAGDGDRALETIRSLRPDLVFLDVEMPGKGGIAVAQALLPEELPALVFVTAYGHYATSAFEVAALDYLVKPFSDSRFAETMERSKKMIRQRRLGDLAEKMVALGSQLNPASTATPPSTISSSREKETPAPQPAGYLTRIRVQARGRSIILKTDDVLWIESDDYYSRLHTREEAFLVRASLTSFENQLDPRCFLRIHRRAIVQIDAVGAIDHLIKGSCALVLDNGTRLKVSRARKKRVLHRLAPRLGG